MKHDGMAATSATAKHRTILVTGFGPFPGAPVNPTLGILDDLSAGGIEAGTLHLARLPVTFSGIRAALAEAASHCRPHVLLMLGLAARRTALSVETLARNHAGRSVPDAEGEMATRSMLVAGAPAALHATWPASHIVAALRDAGQAAALSDDAGDYVCNAALFHALHDALAPMTGFLHVPAVGVAATTPASLAAAARVAIGVMIMASRQRQPAAW